VLSNLAQPVAAQHDVSVEKNVHVGYETALELNAALLHLQDPKALVVDIELQLQCIDMKSTAGGHA
jgi:hypothetical protein